MSRKGRCGLRFFSFSFFLSNLGEFKLDINSAHLEGARIRLNLKLKLTMTRLGSQHCELVAAGNFRELDELLANARELELTVICTICSSCRQTTRRCRSLKVG